MPVTSVEKDLDQLTITITADFAAPLSRLWDAYIDPRQIERFWGPRTYPATFLRHDVVPGGRSVYRMTGPTGYEHYGMLGMDKRHRVAIVRGRRPVRRRDGRAQHGSAGNPRGVRVRGDGNRLSPRHDFALRLARSAQQLLDMQMLEGTTEAMSQIDAVLADLAAFAADRAVEAQVLSDTQVRVSRVVRGSIDQVWRAHNDADLMKQWMLGPDGWTMPVCEPATRVGDSYRYMWAPESGGEGFGFTGELLESQPPYRAVTTEAMIGVDSPATLNELTLTPVEGGTLLSLLITYANAEQRDATLATGMTGGMETSYARLEGLLEVEAGLASQ